MHDVIRFLADDKDEKFYLSDAEEKEMLENLPLADDKMENVLLVW